jgi:hypothetical protein
MVPPTPRCRHTTIAIAISISISIYIVIGVVSSVTATAVAVAMSVGVCSGCTLSAHLISVKEGREKDTQE